MTAIGSKLRDRTSPGIAELRLNPTTPARSRRRSWIAVGVVLVLISALAGAVVIARIADRQPVLALAQPIERGEVLAPEHLRIVEVAADDTLALVAADARGELIGLTAVSALPAGTLLTVGSFTEGPTIPDGWEVVGLALEPGGYPVSTLRPGDLVTVVETPHAAASTTSEGAATGRILAEGAEVFAVEPMGDLTGALMVSVAVPRSAAADIASAGAQDRVRLVLESGR